MGPLSLGVDVGEWVGLIGPNGAGKSTLLQLLAGGLKASGGSVVLDGKPMAHMTPTERAHRIAVVPQHSAPEFDLTVLSVVALGRLSRYRLPHRFLSLRREHLAAVERAMALTDTEVLADRPFSSLSGGEAQRVLLAMALAQETPILLLDEPTAHLDPGHAWKFLQLVQDLVRNEAKTVVMAYHDLSTVGLFCDRLVVLADGQIGLNGPARTVLTSPRLSEIFQIPFLTLEHPVRQQPMLLFP